MADSLGTRLKHGWNAFLNRDEEPVLVQRPFDYGASYGTRPDRVRTRVSNERSIINSVYMRMCVDASMVDMRHVRLDEDRRYLAEIDSPLNNCLTVEANIDQAATAWRMDVISSLFDEGEIALVPIDTNINPTDASFDIHTMRVGKILQWHPRHVKVSVYNDITGRREELTLQKRQVAIVYNPLYSVMNEPNSTLQRLIRKLNLLDSVDEQASSGKLDMIIQLPYVIKSAARREQAEMRRKDIEDQLYGSKYGIAYTDGTEKITQLNRPVENTLLDQIKDLKEQLYAELGVTKAIMDGTADEATMINYLNRTIKPILNAITEAMVRSFLTKTARTQRQSIISLRDPFSLVPVAQLAEIVDKFTRNEVASSNDMRGVIGWKPSGDPRADELRNSNMPREKVFPGSEDSPPNSNEDGV